MRLSVGVSDVRRSDWGSVWNGMAAIGAPSTPSSEIKRNRSHASDGGPATVISPKLVAAVGLWGAVIV